MAYLQNVLSKKLSKWISEEKKTKWKISSKVWSETLDEINNLHLTEEHEEVYSHVRLEKFPANDGQ